ncbi:hypothetical protein [Chitinophaga sp. YIM B06452]|uniref:hypothetical protein n=1 Tax=Chitinophaga sp. YIM B06452 TaxID=3082158 RepID=UPI0031FE6F91
MAKNIETTSKVTKRMLKFAATAIKTGQVKGYPEFAEIAGIQYSALREMVTNGTRNFTLEHLYRIGVHFNLDMNYFIYGKGSPILADTKPKSISEQLKEIIIKLDAEYAGKVKG